MFCATCRCVCSRVMRRVVTSNNPLLAWKMSPVKITTTYHDVTTGSGRLYVKLINYVFSLPVLLLWRMWTCAVWNAHCSKLKQEVRLQIIQSISYLWFTDCLKNVFRLHQYTLFVSSCETEYLVFYSAFEEPEVECEIIILELVSFLVACYFLCKSLSHTDLLDCTTL